MCPTHLIHKGFLKNLSGEKYCNTSLTSPFPLETHTQLYIHKCKLKWSKTALQGTKKGNNRLMLRALKVKHQTQTWNLKTDTEKSGGLWDMLGRTLHSKSPDHTGSYLFQDWLVSYSILWTAEYPSNKSLWRSQSWFPLVEIERALAVLERKVTHSS